MQSFVHLTLRKMSKNTCCGRDFKKRWRKTSVSLNHASWVNCGLCVYYRKNFQKYSSPPVDNFPKCKIVILYIKYLYYLSKPLSRKAFKSQILSSWLGDIVDSHRVKVDSGIGFPMVHVMESTPGEVTSQFQHRCPTCTMFLFEYSLSTKRLSFEYRYYSKAWANRHLPGPAKKLSLEKLKDKWQLLTLLRVGYVLRNEPSE